MADDSQSYELASNDGKTRILFTLAPGTIGAAAELRAGTLAVARSYWDRQKLLDGEFASYRPDVRLEFLQVLFRCEELRFLANALLEWSDLPFVKLSVAQLEVEVQLCDSDELELSLRLGQAPDYSRGDRAGCTLRYRTRAHEDAFAGTYTFVVDISGARRFGGELLAALAPSA